jgi:hypothetical protein
MTEIPPQDITLLLEDCINGKKGAVDKLLPLVYGELKKICRNSFGETGFFFYTVAFLDSSPRSAYLVTSPIIFAARA